MLKFPIIKMFRYRLGMDSGTMETCPKDNWGLMDSPVWPHVTQGQGRIVMPSSVLWDPERTTLSSWAKQWPVLHWNSEVHSKEACASLLELSHLSTAPLYWRGVTSAYNDLYTINTGWESTQKGRQKQFPFWAHWPILKTFGKKEIQLFST